MRIWDVEPALLCREHLLGEHRELHGLWNILRDDKTGYARHPETLRWVGRTRALKARHDALVEEMGRRGYRHASPLPPMALEGPARMDRFLATVQEQKRILQAKGCACQV